MQLYSILLIDNTKIDVTKEELRGVLSAISKKGSIIEIGDYAFAAHQFSKSMPKAEADFAEKTRLREKGFFKCRKYGVVHKLGETCSCRDTGDVDPRLAATNEMQVLPVVVSNTLNDGLLLN